MDVFSSHTAKTRPANAAMKEFTRSGLTSVQGKQPANHKQLPPARAASAVLALPQMGSGLFSGERTPSLRRLLPNSKPVRGG